MKANKTNIISTMKSIYGDSLKQQDAAEVIKKVNLLTANDKLLTQAVVLHLLGGIK